jgi:glycosyltransferase involved in cell wall biosynthesis
VNVLLLDQFSELGGAQRMLLDLLPAIRERNWTAMLSAPPGELVDRTRALGFETVPIPCGSYSSGRKSAADLWRFAFEAPRLAARIREIVRRVDPELVYVNGPRLLPPTALARLSQPVLFHAHLGVSQTAARRLAGLALARLDANVVAVCRNVAAAWQPFVKNPISVIYNGVAGPKSAINRSIAGPPLVGCIGRISPEKGQLEFLDAAARIHAALPETRFVIAGSALFSDAAAQSYEREVRNAAAALPVEFTGWTGDVDAVLARMHLLLVPSIWDEPNPRVILEAFAAGVPVIAFRRGGIPEIVQHGETGFLCDDPREMAIQAIDLLGDPGRLCAIAQAARQSWQREFTRERWQQQMIAAMENCGADRLVSGRRPRRPGS